MSVFTYDPAEVKTWADSIVAFLNGGGESVSTCSKKFGDQLEALVKPNVWSGDAASKNYQNFLETHTSMINFINNFGDAFESAMNSVNKSVTDLEIANLASETEALNNFGSLTYDQLSTLKEQTVTINVVRYDYAAIISIGEQLKSIHQTLQTVNEGLKTKINELDSGHNIWDGNAAAAARTELTNTLNTNMKEIFDNLDICINNIKTAGEAAQNADTAK